MRLFYTWLNHRYSSRFIFITGVMRFRDDLFFIGEDFVDLSMEPDFADLVGFTPEEVEIYYAPYYQHAAQVLDTLPFFSRRWSQAKLRRLLLRLRSSDWAVQPAGAQWVLCDH